MLFYALMTQMTQELYNANFTCVYVFFYVILNQLTLWPTLKMHLRAQSLMYLMKILMFLDEGSTVHGP